MEMHNTKNIYEVDYGEEYDVDDSVFNDLDKEYMDNVEEHTTKIDVLFNKLLMIKQKRIRKRRFIISIKKMELANKAKNIIMKKVN